MGWSVGLTEAVHGSDATHMDTRAIPEIRDGLAGYQITGEKMWITDVHKTSRVMTFAHTNGEDG
jgi:acyl-CoA dehydrogenase